MPYNWKKHLKNKKSDEDFIQYVVNTNTNIIYKFDTNPHYKSTKECRADGTIQDKIQKRKRQYVKLRQDGELDYKKTAPCSTVNKWVSQDYVIECKTYNNALYLQALLRMEKTEGETSDEWRAIALRIQDEYPEDLI